MSRIPPAIYQAMVDRADERCEACGWPAFGKMDAHHRLPRSHGGKDTLANLIYVHHECHVVSPWAIHQNPARSYRLKHLLKTGADPDTEPFLTEPMLRKLRK